MRDNSMASESTNPSMGYLYIFLCCFTNGISFVFIAHLTKTHNEMLSIALTFGYATILFNLFNLKRIIALYGLVVKNFKLLTSMNLASLFNWISSFFVLKYLDPATAICVIFGIIAVVMVFIIIPLHKFRENKHLILCILLILISMSLIIKQYSITNVHTSTQAILLGVMWCIIGGVSGAFIGICSQRMGQAGFTVTKILATRFYFLVIVSGFAFLFVPHAPVIIDWKYYLLASLIIVFFPLLMYQAAVRELGPLIASLLEPFTPIVTYFLQILVGSYRFNIVTMLLLVITSSSIIWLVRLEQKLAQQRQEVHA